MYYIINYAITHYKFSKFDKKISGHKACKIFRCQTPEYGSAGVFRGCGSENFQTLLP